MDPIAVSIADRRSDETTFSLVTASARLSDGSASAAWRDVKLIIGDVAVDVAALRDPRLIRAWKRYNPNGP